MRTAQVAGHTHKTSHVIIGVQYIIILYGGAEEEGGTRQYRPIYGGIGNRRREQTPVNNVRRRAHTHTHTHTHIQYDDNATTAAGQQPPSGEIKKKKTIFIS
uniref:Uncharacterized protein n=1 Tax=Schizaphis graminum TaxID=13262 RepID=A0A2S2PD81_SCHGA